MGVPFRMPGRSGPATAASSPPMKTTPVFVLWRAGAERDVKGTGRPGPLGDEGRDVKRLTTLR